MLNRKLRGSVVIEASYIVPVTLMIYWILILLAFILFQRCLETQRNFLQEFQQERKMIVLEKNYGEVIYGGAY